MASINGITVKGLKPFKDHEGLTIYQGNVYLGSKKLGFWSQDFMSGEDTVSFDMAYSEGRLNREIARLNPHKAMHGNNYKGEPYTIKYDLSLLMYDLIRLADYEKKFKKAAKEGYAMLLLATDGYHETWWRLPAGLAKLSDTAILERMSADIREAQMGFFKNKEHEVMIYRSLEDFNIGEPIKLEDILARDSDYAEGWPYGN